MSTEVHPSVDGDLPALLRDLQRARTAGDAAAQALALDALGAERCTATPTLMGALCLGGLDLAGWLVQQQHGDWSAETARLAVADLLMALLEPPSRLNLNARGGDVLIQGDDQPARKLTAGTPRSRVNTNGTSTILATWKNSSRLTITERYDRKRQYYEIYTLQPADGSLLVTREVQRPGLKPLRLQAVYRRS